MYCIMNYQKQTHQWMSGQAITKVLMEECAGQSVSIVKQLDSGIRQVTYVCVSDDGLLTDTYTGAPVSLLPSTNV